MLRNAEEATAKLQAEKLDLQAQRDELQAVRLHTSQQIDNQLIKCHRPANLQVSTMRHVHMPYLPLTLEVTAPVSQPVTFNHMHT